MFDVRYLNWPRRLCALEHYDNCVRNAIRPAKDLALTSRGVNGYYDGPGEEDELSTSPV